MKEPGVVVVGVVSAEVICRKGQTGALGCKVLGGDVGER